MSFRGPQALIDRKGDSDSILASSLAGDTARCLVKRRQRYRWAGLLSFEKPVWIRMPTPFRCGGRQHGNCVNASGCSVLRSLRTPRTLRNNMHENREISSAPWSCDQGRSAKAMKRTADMHALEKSDCAVVPVNRSNKEAQASAEAGEGRAQTKENIVQSHMRPTQSGLCVSQGLHGVRQAARKRKQERFTALLHHRNVELLRDSFFALKRQASPGIDGVRWQEYEPGLQDRLTNLHRRVHRGAYRAQASRRVYIPKADGRQRPLGVAALEDIGHVISKKCPF